MVDNRELAEGLRAAAVALQDAREKWERVALMLALDAPLSVSEVAEAAEELIQAQAEALQLFAAISVPPPKS